jgi:hypothetical protein
MGWYQVLRSSDPGIPDPETPNPRIPDPETPNPGIQDSGIPKSWNRRSQDPRSWNPEIPGSQIPESRDSGNWHIQICGYWGYWGCHTMSCNTLKGYITCMHTCVYICIHTYTPTPMGMGDTWYPCMYVHMYVCMYVCMYMYVYMCAWCIYVMFINDDVHDVSACMYVHVHTCVHVCDVCMWCDVCVHTLSLSISHWCGGIWYACTCVHILLMPINGIMWSVDPSLWGPDIPDISVSGIWEIGSDGFAC